MRKSFRNALYLDFELELALRSGSLFKSSLESRNVISTQLEVQTSFSGFLNIL